MRVLVACMLLVILSGCAETSCTLARHTGYYCPKGMIGGTK